MKEIIDISPLVDSTTAVFPGDVSFQRDVSMTFEGGGNLALSSMNTTLHIGAHADAPSHYVPHGAPIDERPLDLYMGPCEVVRVNVERGRRILPEDIGQKLRAPRVLFATASQPDPAIFNDDFNSLSPELVDWAHEQGVCLVGIDTPSVDPAADKELLSHQRIAKRDMAILEGLVLQHVEPGLYELIALPLRLKGADASPLRAVLVA